MKKERLSVMFSVEVSPDSSQCFWLETEFEKASSNNSEPNEPLDVNSEKAGARIQDDGMKGASKPGRFGDFFGWRAKENPPSTGLEYVFDQLHVLSMAVWLADSQ
jgi:hypothetical protein